MSRRRSCEEGFVVASPAPVVEKKTRKNTGALEVVKEEKTFLGKSIRTTLSLLSLHSVLVVGLLGASSSSVVQFSGGLMVDEVVGGKEISS